MTFTKVGGRTVYAKGKANIGISTATIIRAAGIWIANKAEGL